MKRYLMFYKTYISILCFSCSFSLLSMCVGLSINEGERETRADPGTANEELVDGEAVSLV